MSPCKDIDSRLRGDNTRPMVKKVTSYGRLAKRGQNRCKKAGTGLNKGCGRNGQARQSSQR